MISHISQFKQAMERDGLPMDSIPIDDGAIQRFHVEGDTPSSRNGWYVLYSDGVPAGIYGRWKTDESYRCVSKPN